MKYLVLLCDGMADTPVPELGGKTPMEAAKKPNMDALAKGGDCKNGSRWDEARKRCGESVRTGVSSGRLLHRPFAFGGGQHRH